MPRRLPPPELFREGMESLAEAVKSLRRRAGWRRVEGEDESNVFELTLKIPLRKSEIREVAYRHAHELRARLESEVMANGLLVPGRSWCFNSQSFDSQYSRPEDPRQVLVGYGLEGRPRFADLVTLAIERKHEAVEQLLAGKEGAVSFVEPGEKITEGVRPAFDPDQAPHRLLAQAMIGLFASAEEGRRVALTIQVLTRDAQDGNVHLLAHPVCAIDLLDLPDASTARILKGFQQKMNLLAKQLSGKIAAGEEVDATEAVLPELRDLVHRLSQDARNRARKTTHARERESQGKRPTQLAFPEARSARDHHLYRDNEEGTVIVIGKKGRVHVFSPDGRHVTTVVMSPSSVRQRVSAGRWREAEPAERGSFRDAISARRGEEP
ncbi:MAG: hypothetical protein ACE5F1_21205 [Planctomycetota bacterium]